MTNLRNPILSADSYKLSHYKQYPAGTTHVSAYLEARQGGTFDKVLFFGLQMFLKDYLSKPFTYTDLIEAEEVATKHGLPFNREGFEDILTEHRGYWPIEIRAIPEGSVVPCGTPLIQVTNTDPRHPWLSTFIETALLRAVWYPSTVATLSWHAKQGIKSSLERTCDDDKIAGVLSFRLHDFGQRGVSSNESAGIGGLAHLVNFMGTDTTAALLYAREFYGEQMAGYSIPAAEHSTITSWGRADEVAAYRNMLRQFGGPDKLVVVVSDSYDLDHAVSNIWGGELQHEVLQMGGTLVVRPDSGDPVTTPVRVLQTLWEKFGGDFNSKGFKVLHPSVRVIQGDGLDLPTIERLLTAVEVAGFSTENIAMGMGGGLLQKVDRDTLRFAMKANAIRFEGNDAWIGVNKVVKTDPTKASKNGHIPEGTGGLELVWRNGAMFRETTLAEVRAIAASSLS
jgi:nicotinamide phosphoribosyltransferase